MNQTIPKRIFITSIQLSQPERLMKRLCKHWGHKFPVELSERQGSIQLPLGTCRMSCTDMLQVELDADAEQMPRLQAVVEDHLRRMANPEELVIEWQEE